MPVEGHGVEDHDLDEVLDVVDERR